MWMKFYIWILVIDGWGISCEIALIWMSLDFPDDQSTLVQVMAWCRQATSHYLSQCWPNSMSPYGVSRPQWVKTSICSWTWFTPVLTSQRWIRLWLGAIRQQAITYSYVDSDKQCHFASHSHQIAPFHKDLSPSGEQLEHRKLAKTAN